MKNGTIYVCKYKGLQFSDFRRKGTVLNACEEIAENLDFEEDNYFIRESAEAAVRGCSVRNSQQNTRDGVLLQ